MNRSTLSEHCSETVYASHSHLMGNLPGLLQLTYCSQNPHTSPDLLSQDRKSLARFLRQMFLIVTNTVPAQPAFTGCNRPSTATTNPSKLRSDSARITVARCTVSRRHRPPYPGKPTAHLAVTRCAVDCQACLRASGFSRTGGFAKASSCTTVGKPSSVHRSRAAVSASRTGNGTTSASRTS
jgi:hypothetical protein